jgi:hypothetical protein
LSSTLHAPTTSETAQYQADPTHAPQPGPDGGFDAARQRLRAAIGALDAAIGHQNERTLERSDQMAEYAALQEDRCRLALELEAEKQRTRALEAASDDASRRIERAARAVRAVLAADSPRENQDGEDASSGNGASFAPEPPDCAEAANHDASREA